MGSAGRAVIWWVGRDFRRCTSPVRRGQTLNNRSNRAASTATASRAGPGPDALGGGGQGLGVLDAEDIERSQTHARGGRRGKHLGEACKSHRCFRA